MKNVTFLHGIAAFAGLFLIIAMSLGSSHQTTDVSMQDRNANPITIGVEHAYSLTLTVEMSTLNGGAIVDMQQDDAETIFVSVPATWEKREVRNVPIDSVTADPPQFGFTRWHLPSHGGISFRVPQAPSRIEVQNPSGVLMKVNFTHVDLNTDDVFRDVVLVKDQIVELM